LQVLPKRIYSSPSAWYPLLEFFKSIFWITLSSGYGRWKGFLQFPGSRTSVIVTLERPMRAATVLVVRAFHAWNLLDNFQWAEGYTER
jgi:hypothetical protein